MCHTCMDHASSCLANGNTTGDGESCHHTHYLESLIILVGLLGIHFEHIDARLMVDQTKLNRACANVTKHFVVILLKK